MYESAAFTLVDSLSNRVLDASAIGALAVALDECRAHHGVSRLAICIDDKFKLVAVLLAASQLDVRIIPLDPSFVPEARNAYIEAGGADAFISDRPVSKLPDGMVELAIDDLISATSTAVDPASFARMQAHWLFFTSGSTSTPKGVLITPQMLRGNVAIALKRLPYGDNFSTASLLPAFHTFTLVSDIMTAFALGSRCVVMPNFEVGQLDHIVTALVEHKVNTFSAVPVIFEVLARLGARLANSDLRFVTSGAAPLTARLGQIYGERIGHALIPCYGMTEGVCFLSISDHTNIKFGSAGVPVVDLRIADEHDEAVPQGVVGEIQVRGETVITDGYFGPSAGRDHVYATGGWLRTGDLGYRDEDGVLFITGRTKNMIIRGGRKIYLEDLEALFEIGTVACIPDGKGDRERFTIFFEDGRYHDQFVLDRIRAGLGVEHLPDRAIAISRIPKTPTGKLQRRILAEELRNGNY